MRATLYRKHTAYTGTPDVSRYVSVNWTIGKWICTASQSCRNIVHHEGTLQRSQSAQCKAEPVTIRRFTKLGKISTLNSISSIYNHLYDQNNL